MITVLVTAVGGGVGQSVVDCLSEKPDQFMIIGCDSGPNLYALSQCDLFLELPHSSAPEYISKLLDICKRNYVEFLIPGHDKELWLISKNKHLFEHIGVSVIVSEPELIQISRDKETWASTFSDHIPTVPTYKLTNISLTDFPEENLPAVIKPTGGSASSDVFIVNTIDELSVAVQKYPGHVCQKYLFPHKGASSRTKIESSVENGKLIQIDEISLQLTYNNNCELVGVFCSINELKNGIPVVIQPVNPIFYEREIKKIDLALKKWNVKGPVNLQGRQTDDGIIFFEMNLRFTGITGCRSYFGYNEAVYLIQNWNGEAGELKLGNYEPQNRVGVRQVASRVLPIMESKDSELNFTLVGGSGFIAKNTFLFLIEKYPSANISVLSRDKQSCSILYENLTNATLTNERLSFYDYSYCQMSEAVCKSSIVVNCAFPLANVEPESFLSALSVSYTLSRVIERYAPDLLINLSSQSVYGNFGTFDETSECKPSKIYGHGKLMQEKSFDPIKLTNRKTKIVNLRLARIIGGFEYEKLNQFPVRMLYSFLNKTELSVNASNGMSFLDMRDFLLLLNNIITYDLKDIPNILNCYSYNTSLSNMLEVCKTITHSENDKIVDLTTEKPEELFLSSLYNDKFCPKNISLNDSMSKIHNNLLNK